MIKRSYDDFMIFKLWQSYDHKFQIWGSV